MRYVLKNLEIVDTQHALGRVSFHFGKHAKYFDGLIPQDMHRASYTRDDAQAVVDWLNERPTADQLAHQGRLHALLREQAKPWRAYKMSRPGLPVTEHQLDYNADDWQSLSDLRSTHHHV